MTVLSQMLYVSRVSPAPDEASQLSQIAIISGRNNEADAITGRLLKAGDAFVQVCEGPRGPLTRLTGRILADPRHSEARILHFVPIEKRIFGDWSFSVGLADPDEDVSDAGYESLSAWNSERLLTGLVHAKLDTSCSIKRQVSDDSDLIIV